MKLFKRNKHVFTCPDVIYLRARAKRNNRIVLIAYGATILVGWAALLASDSKEKTETLTEDTTVDYPQFND